LASAQHVLAAPPSRELWARSACELGAAFEKREISPVEVLDAVFARYEEVNPVLNALVTVHREGARQAARASEARWCNGQALGPLDGVPVTVKDNIPVRGLRTTWGSRLLADYVPAEDELPIARLRGAGAVILGKTNVPEFTLQGYTHNEVFGTTRNPWDLRLTPGGSSGGAVAAVAAGIGPLAVGTDGGGSIRRPAAHTGLLGIKPSPGRVPRANGLPAILHDFEAVGAMARTTADAALLLHGMSGPDARDRSSLAHSSGRSGEPLGSLRILYVPAFGGAPVDPDIRASVAAAVQDLAALGHKVEEGEAPFDLAALDHIWGLVGPAGLACLLSGRPGWEHLVQPNLRGMAEQGSELRASDYVGALNGVARLRTEMPAIFARHQVIMTPAVAALPWAAEETHPTEIDGKAVGPRGHAVFTAIANAAGLPALSMPCRPSGAGLPIGAQLIGDFASDELLLALAAQFEQARPWAERWPTISGRRDS
jgi:aspartyl-tRNA(Asn)/glutamyl-tRNA(Gln) amidotransferase subunit A